MVVRGDLLEEAELREDANENHELYGFWAISVFAADDDARLEEHAATKLVRARILVLIKVGDLLDAGLELCDTGQAPHYDIVHEDLSELVHRLLACRHAVEENPHYEDETSGGETVTIELKANLNNEDDEGLNWGLLRNAREPRRVQPGAVLTAGSPDFWSWVRVVRVDPDGQVHFRQISSSEARRHESVATTRH